MQVITDWRLEFTADDVLRGQGIHPGRARERRPQLAEAAEWALQMGLPLVNPQVAINILEVEKLRHEKIFLSGGKFIAGSLITAQLVGAQQVAAAVCTIGQALEDLSAEILSEDALLGMALDGLGTAAVDLLSVQVCGYVGQVAHQRGKHTTAPYSPGMVGWPVDSGQDQIFSMLDAQAIGVTLTESRMMHPRKSLSLALGIGPEPQASQKTCDFCSLNASCRYKDSYEPHGAGSIV